MFRRAIELAGTDITLELSGVTAVKIRKNLFHLDELPDGTWRLTFNTCFFSNDESDVKDIVDVESIDLSNGKFSIRGLGEFEMIKPVAVKTDKRMFHLEELANKKWKLIYNGDHVPDFAAVKGFRFVRED
jgi:hypothetical protein